MKRIIYIIVAIGLVALAMCRTKEAETQALSYHKLEGSVFHTIYHITYQGERDYHDEIKQLFKEFDGSLSMFNDTSIITRRDNCDTSVVANR